MTYQCSNYFKNWWHLENPYRIYFGWPYYCPSGGTEFCSKYSEQCSDLLLGLPLIVFYWRNYQIVLRRPFKWPGKAVKQANDNSRGNATEHLGISGSLAVDVNTSSGEYLQTSTQWKKALALEYLSDFFCGYCLGVYLSECRRITLDDHYFMVIFMLKVGNL